METVILELKGTKCTFEKDRRFGTWSVSLGGGRPPEILQGAWSSLQELQDRTEYYLYQRGEKRVRKEKKVSDAKK